MSRKEELLKIIDNNIVFIPLVDQIISIETKLTELEGLPFYKVNPKNPEQQKMLPAFRIYKEMLQQYTNCLKALDKCVGSEDDSGESPLRKWVESRVNSE